MAGRISLGVKLDCQIVLKMLAKDLIYTAKINLKAIRWHSICVVVALIVLCICFGKTLLILITL